MEVLKDINKKTSWFISDTNFGNTLKAKSMNKTVDEYDEYLAEMWNSIVKPNDIVYHIGGLTLYDVNDNPREIIKKLNFKKMYYTHGFLDSPIKLDKLKIMLENRLTIAPKLSSTNLCNKQIITCHNPLEFWPKPNKNIHVHGNSLGVKIPYKYNRFEVSSYKIGFRPICFDMLLECIEVTNGALVEEGVVI